MILTKISFFFCSGFGVGYLTTFPGTLASVAILPIVWLAKSHLPLTTITFILILYFVISFFLLRVALKNEQNKDPSHFVCDEYIGQTIPLMFCNEKFLDYLIAFISFRALDIFKPFPINYFDKIKSEVGVLFDDIVAGSLVAFCFFYYYSL